MSPKDKNPHLPKIQKARRQGKAKRPKKPKIKLPPPRAELFDPCNKLRHLDCPHKVFVIAPGVEPHHETCACDCHVHPEKYPKRREDSIYKSGGKPDWWNKRYADSDGKGGDGD